MHSAILKGHGVYYCDLVVLYDTMLGKAIAANVMTYCELHDIETCKQSETFLDLVCNMKEAEVLLKE